MAAGGFTAIDLSQLPAPQLIEPLDYERVLAERKASFLTLYAALRAARPDLPEIDLLDLESEPVTVLLQENGYRELLLRNLVNKKALAVLLAFSFGSDLDHIGAALEVKRMTVTPATDTVPAVMEDDERYRRRIALAPEALSVAGPRGAYVFHALGHDIRIADVHAYATLENARAGEINIVVAGYNGQPVPDAVLTGLLNLFSGEDLVPATDVPLIRRATVITVPVTQELIVARGPDPVLIKTAAETAIAAYMASRYAIGRSIFRAGLTAAGKVGGVDNVVMPQPAADVICGPDDIASPGALAVTTTVV